MTRNATTSLGIFILQQNTSKCINLKRDTFYIYY